MQTVEILEIHHTGKNTSDQIFNSNFLPGANTGETPWGGNTGNEVGSPTIESLEALDTFDIDFVRFPAGQGKEIFSEHGIIANGDLPSFLRNFLEHAQANGTLVSLVVPVESLEPYGGPGVGQILSDLETLASIVERDFPGVVAHYELGNEYWGKRETEDDTREVEYGEAAARAALALKTGTESAGGEVKTVIQAASFLGGAYDGDISDANAAIQSGFNSVTADSSMVSGVLRNFYWRDPGVSEFHNTEGIFQENRGIDESFGGDTGSQWDIWAGRSLERLVGEYNVQNSVARNLEWHSDIGVHGASMLLEHITNLISAEVDVAFLWPVLHNTMNALIHRHEAIETASINDLLVVTNSTRAALFDILRQTVSGYELVEFSWASPVDVELTGFQGIGEFGQSENVLYISSRTDDVETIEIDVSDFIGDLEFQSGISIFYEDEGGNHRDAVLNEITVGDLGFADGSFSLTLQPFEVVQITFGSASNFDLTEGSDSQDGTVGDDFIESLGGDDFIFALEGSDTVSGGAGNDFIDGGHGDDRLFGGNGDDTVAGDNGNDDIFGGSGDDLLIGGGNSDVIDGGDGDDTLEGSWGFDTLLGGEGDDTLDGGSGIDHLTGGSGRDTFVFNTFDGRMNVITDFEFLVDTLAFYFDGTVNEPDAFVIEEYGDGESSIIKYVKNGVVDNSFGGVILEGFTDIDWLSDKGVSNQFDAACFLIL